MCINEGFYILSLISLEIVLLDYNVCTSSHLLDIFKLIPKVALTNSFIFPLAVQENSNSSLIFDKTWYCKAS